mgnify:CR=1 FL=1
MAAIRYPHELVVAFGLLFELFLNAAFHFGQTAHSVIRLLKADVSTVLRYQQPAACGFEHTVDGLTADHVTAGE